MSSRAIVGFIWLAGLIAIFVITCKPGAAPTEMEALGYTLAFVLQGGVWSAVMGMIAFFFTSKGDPS